MKKQSILDFWDYKRNKEDPPKKQSNKKYFWQCPKDEEHFWEAVVSNVIRATERGTLKCPFCVNRKVCSTNNLKFKFPEIAKQWHPTKNKGLKPEDVVYSTKHKAWWLCPVGHEYNSQIGERTRRNTGCNKCNKTTSKPQYRIYTELKYLFPKTKIDYRFDSKNHNKEIDIYIPEIFTGIEYDGRVFHNRKVKSDTLKSKLIRDLGILLIRVREGGLNNSRDLDYFVNFRKFEKKDINNILTIASKNIVLTNDQVNKIEEYKKEKDFVNNDLFQKLIIDINRVPYEKSFAFLCPDLAKEWHPTKNKFFKPENFTKTSGQKVWWKCLKHGHEWEAYIYARTRSHKSNVKGVHKSWVIDRKGSNCPECVKLYRAKGFKEVSLEESIFTTHNYLLDDWDYSKNFALTPKNISAGSDCKIHWVCKICKHKWVAKVARRTFGTGCPKWRSHKNLS